MAARKLWAAMAGLEHRPEAAAEAAEAAEAAMAGSLQDLQGRSSPEISVFPEMPFPEASVFPEMPFHFPIWKGFFSIWKDALPFLQS
jgi:hypothetical protein